MLTDALESMFGKLKWMANQNNGFGALSFTRVLRNYILGKDRNNLFLTQTPQAFNLNEIYELHRDNADKYKDDDISLYMNFKTHDY